MHLLLGQIIPFKSPTPYIQRQGNQDKKTLDNRPLQLMSRSILPSFLAWSISSTVFTSPFRALRSNRSSNCSRSPMPGHMCVCPLVCVPVCMLSQRRSGPHCSATNDWCVADPTNIIIAWCIGMKISIYPQYFMLVHVSRAHPVYYAVIHCYTYMSPLMEFTVLSDCMSHYLYVNTLVNPSKVIVMIFENFPVLYHYSKLMLTE